MEDTVQAGDGDQEGQLQEQAQRRGFQKLGGNVVYKKIMHEFANCTAIN